MQFRYSAFAFLLLANFILLGHSVLPHHHYETHIKFVHSNPVHNHQKLAGHHEHEGHVENTNNLFHQHEHDAEDNHSNCSLSSIVALQARQLRNTVNVYDSNLHTPNIVFSDFINVENDFTVSFIEKTGEILIPPNEVSFIEFCPNSNKLRGPPTI